MSLAMARTGKIARLPLAIREEINERLRENESGQTILEWLNGQPVVQDILKAQFEGTPINDQNLSNWREGGFADWLGEQEKVHKIHKLSELSLRLAQASGGNLSEGLMAIAAGKLHEALEAGLEVVAGAEGEDPEIIGVSLDKLTKAITASRGMELEKQKLVISRLALDQKGEILALEKKKFQRTTAELFLKWFDDKRTQEIAEGKGAKDTKVAELIQLWFGDMPEGIGPAELQMKGGS